MVIAISAPVQLSSTQNTTTVRINAADGEVTTLPPQVSVSKISAKITITPAPVIQPKSDPIEGEPVLESPTIKITEQSADSNNLNKQSLPQTSTLDKRPQQIQALNQQQQDINLRQSELSEQEQAIEREIAQLQQREVEINRKKFQLRQSTGNLLNIQV